MFKHDIATLYISHSFIATTITTICRFHCIKHIVFYNASNRRGRCLRRLKRRRNNNRFPVFTSEYHSKYISSRQKIDLKLPKLVQIKQTKINNNTNGSKSNTRNFLSMHLLQ